MPWSDGTGCLDLSYFLTLSFKPAFSLFIFTFIKRLMGSSSLSAIRVVSSAYVRLSIFLLAIFISACDSFSPAFHVMHSACKLNKQGDNTQPCHTPFPLWNQSVVPCLVLNVASWPAYRFFKWQIRWSGTPISKNFPVCSDPHTEGFSIVNETEVDVFSGILLLSPWSNECRQFDLWFLCLFVNPAYTSGNSCFIYCWSLTWRILSITLLACEMSTIVW